MSPNVIKDRRIFESLRRCFFLTWTHIFEFYLQKNIRVSLKLYLKWRTKNNVMNDIFFYLFHYTHVFCTYYIRLWQLVLIGNISVVCWLGNVNHIQIYLFGIILKTNLPLSLHIKNRPSSNVIVKILRSWKLSPVWCH